MPCKPTPTINKPIMIPLQLSMTPSTRGSLTPTTAHPLALLHPCRSRMNPEAFTPKTVENFASLLGYLEKEESLSSAKGCLPCQDFC